MIIFWHWQAPTAQEKGAVAAKAKGTGPPPPPANSQDPGKVPGKGCGKVSGKVTGKARMGDALKGPGKDKACQDIRATRLDPTNDISKGSVTTTPETLPNVGC